MLNRKINRSTMLKAILLIVLTFEIVLIWYFFGIPCLIKHVTGVICPGCGMTRAWMSVLKLDFKMAMYYNPVFWIVSFLPKLIFNNGKLFENKMLNAIALTFGIVAITVTYGVRLWAYLNGIYVI